MTQASAPSRSLEKIRRLAAAPPAKGRAGALATLAMDVKYDRALLLGDVVLVRDVMDTIRAVRAAAGAGRARTESTLMGVLESLILSASLEEKPAAHRKSAREMWAFGLESLAFRHHRDSTVWQRHQQAYALLTAAALGVAAAEVLALARRALRSEQEVDVEGGLQLLDECVHRRGGDPGRALVRELEAVLRRTRVRSNLVGALGLLVRLGAWDEFGALTTVEDWDEQQERRARREWASRQRP